jgi:hypothetical protein
MQGARLVAQARERMSDTRGRGDKRTNGKMLSIVEVSKSCEERKREREAMAWLAPTCNIMYFDVYTGKM